MKLTLRLGFVALFVPPGRDREGEREGGGLESGPTVGRSVK